MNTSILSVFLIIYHCSVVAAEFNTLSATNKVEKAESQTEPVTCGKVAIHSFIYVTRYRDKPNLFLLLFFASSSHATNSGVEKQSCACSVHLGR
jgi:hypothetical protein